MTTTHGFNASFGLTSNLKSSPVTCRSPENPPPDDRTSMRSVYVVGRSNCDRNHTLARSVMTSRALVAGSSEHRRNRMRGVSPSVQTLADAATSRGENTAEFRTPPSTLSATLSRLTMVGAEVARLKVALSLVSRFST